MTKTYHLIPNTVVPAQFTAAPFADLSAARESAAELMRDPNVVTVLIIESVQRPQELVTRSQAGDPLVIDVTGNVSLR